MADPAGAIYMSGGCRVARRSAEDLKGLINVTQAICIHCDQGRKQQQDAKFKLQSDCELDAIFRGEDIELQFARAIL